MIRRGRYLVEVGAVAALAAAKLWLTYGRPLCPRYLLYDDLLFLRLADGIVQTGWLGPYDQLTLIKGPVYPLFIAANLSAALPILLTQEVVYLLGCGAMTLALAPVLRNRVARVATFAICVFNPITLSRDSSLAAAGAVLMREPLYASLALLVVAGVVGMWTHRDARLGWRLAWALLLGCALGPFWLTREEGLWIVPLLGLLYVLLGSRLLQRRLSRRERVTSVALLAGPLCVWAVTLLAVMAINHARYGVFLLNDLHAGAFPAAYGALTRVEHENWRPHVPVPRDVRARIYETSPAFRQLQPHLEDPKWGWFGQGCPFIPTTCGDIGGGWFLWALREAVSELGLHQTAAQAQGYYMKLAGEVNRACEIGHLRCGGHRASMLEPVRPYHRELFPTVLFEEVRRTIDYSEVTVDPVACPAATIDAKWIALYQRLSFAPTTQSALVSGQRVWWSQRILAGYRWGAPRLLFLGVVAWLLSFALLAGGRAPASLAPATLLLVALCVRFLVQAVVDVVLGAPYVSRYFEPAYPLLLFFSCVSLYGLSTHLLRRRPS